MNNYKSMPRAELIAELEAWEGKFEREVQAQVDNRIEEEKHLLMCERRELAEIVNRFEVSKTYEDFSRLARAVYSSKFLTEIALPWCPARFSPRKREMLAFISECETLLQKGRKIREGENQ